jgi:hypothetical protein
MTREQYAGKHKSMNIFDAHRDALNPAVNTQALKKRLWLIDHYKYRYGADHTYWVHALLRRTASHASKYKFNYALKAFLAFNAYTAYTNYRYVDSMSLMSTLQRGSHYWSIGLSSAAFGAAMAML